MNKVEKWIYDNKKLLNLYIEESFDESREKEFKGRVEELDVSLLYDFMNCTNSIDQKNKYCDKENAFVCFLKSKSVLIKLYYNFDERDETSEVSLDITPSYIEKITEEFINEVRVALNFNRRGILSRTGHGVYLTQKMVDEYNWSIEIERALKLNLTESLD